MHASDIGLNFDILLRHVTVCYTGVSVWICRLGVPLLTLKIAVELKAIDYNDKFNGKAKENIYGI